MNRLVFIEYDMSHEQPSTQEANGNLDTAVDGMSGAGKEKHKGYTS